MSAAGGFWAKEAEEFVRALDLEYGRKPSTFH
jgi:hypothetical protein